MSLTPVVDQPIHPTPLDPVGLLAYVLLLVVVTLATMRRPVFGACALVFVQPFAFYRDIAHTTVTLPKVALAAVLLGLCATPGIFAFLRESRARAMLLAGGAVVAASLLSLLVAQHHAEAARETLKQLYYVLIFAAVYICYRADANRRFAIVAIAAATVIVSLLALSQEVIGAPSAFVIGGHPLPRIAGALEGPNQLAGYLEIAAPLLFAALAWEASALTQTALFLALFADVLTFSRGGLFGCALALVIVVIAYRAKWHRPIATVVAGVVAGTFVASVWGWLAHVSSISRFWNFSEANYAGGVGKRSLLWQAAVRMWRSHPLLGVGAGNFELDLPQYGLHGIRTHANSLYLQALAEGGIPLFAATVSLFVTAIRVLVSRIAASPIAVAALAATIALAVHQIADDVFFYPKVGGLWWAVVALGAVEVHGRGRTPE